jgi:hypothetical protein
MMLYRLAMGCAWLGLLGMLGAWSPVSAQVPVEPGKLPAHVQTLVGQLENAPSEKQKETAEWELLKLGPDILPLLPAPDKMSSALKTRLVPIQDTLRELLPRTVKGWGKDDLLLSAALKRLQAETGITMVDRRQDGSDHRVTLDRPGATFWQAVDALASQVKASLSLYQADGKVALIDAPYRALPLSLHGPFRVAFKRAATTLDLDAGTHICVVALEIAWEPRFLPIRLEAGSASLRAGTNASGQPFVAEVPGRGALQAKTGLAQEFELLFPAPDRQTKMVEELKGHFVVLTPVKMLTFQFKDLKAWGKPGPSKTQDGVQVTIDRIDVSKDRWIVDVVIDNPKAGPQFESHQMSWWLANHALYLEKGAGETVEVLEPERLLGDLKVTSTEARIRYHFLTKRANGVPLSAWRLVCRTPGRMVEVTVPYTFKDLRLP